MILLLHLLGFYIIGVVLSYGFIHLNNQIPQYEGNYIKPIQSFKSWYFLFEVYTMYKH